MIVGRIPWSIVQIFGVARFLILAKPSGGIWLIVVGRCFIGWWVGHCLFNYVMFFLHIYCHISSMWLLRADVKLWFMISKLLYMSISIGWCFRWTLLMPSTPFCVRSFSKNFGQQKANYHKFSLLFVLFTLWSFFYFLIIISFQEICPLSFPLLMCIKAIRPPCLFFLLPTFVFYVFFGVLSLCLFPSLVANTHIFSLVSFISFFFFFCFSINVRGVSCSAL